MKTFRSSRPKWLRLTAIATSVLFVWSMLLAQPAGCLADMARRPLQGVRKLTPAEMEMLVGSQHALSYSANAGPTFPWEGTINGVNTGNGCKVTEIPIFAWTNRGGMRVDMTLYHSSQSGHNSELGHKWTFFYDIYLPTSGNNAIVQWGNDLSYTFTGTVSGGVTTYTAPTGIHDSLVKNIDGTWTLTTPNQLNTAPKEPSTEPVPRGAPRSQRPYSELHRV